MFQKHEQSKSERVKNGYVHENIIKFAASN